MKSIKISNYLKDLASAGPVPGGGSASALVAALGAGLLEKACNLTIGKERFKPVEAEFKQALKIIKPIRKRLEELIELDMSAYLPVAKAYKMPKDTEQQKLKRKKQIQRAEENAKKVPQEIMKLSVELLQYCDSIEKKGNQFLAGDVRCAKVLLEAASRSTENFI